MNILFVSAVFPYPLHSGGQIRMYHLLARLSKKHSITLVSFIRNQEEEQFIKELSFCHEVYTVLRGRARQPSYLIKALTGKYPWLLATYDNEKMKTLLTSLIEAKQYDLLHTEPFYVLPSIPQSELPLVVSEHNIEYHVYGEYAKNLRVPLFRPFAQKDVQKIKTWEEKSWRDADAVTAVSEDDARVIQNYLSHEIHVVPNGVDLEKFPFTPHSGLTRKLLFVGNFRWLPNVEAARRLVSEIWPLIHQKFPDTTLKIIGRNFPEALKREVVACEIVDHVEDIASEYQVADLLIAPHAIGGGTKFKILESFASGLPVITTAEGMQGIEALPGSEYLAARTAEDFVSQVAFVFENKKEMKKITKNARSLVEKKFDWNNIADSLDKVWRKVYGKNN